MDRDVSSSVVVLVVVAAAAAGAVVGAAGPYHPHDCHTAHPGWIASGRHRWSSVLVDDVRR